jgi:hypothetical protein
MRINNIKITATEFAYDGCHKIYLIESLEDKLEALDTGYELLPIENLKQVFKDSCSLKFISNWKLDKTIVSQFENYRFMESA